VPAPAPRVAIQKARHHRESQAFRRVVVQLGRRLRDARLDRGWTVDKAAQRYGVEPAHVRRVETGRTNPSLATLVDIARALGIELADLLAEEAARPAGRRRPAAKASRGVRSATSGTASVAPKTPRAIPSSRSRPLRRAPP